MAQNGKQTGETTRNLTIATTKITPAVDAANPPRPAGGIVIGKGASMTDEWKSLKVKPDTHQKVKTAAAMQGKTIDVFLADLMANEQYLTARFAALGRRPTEEERAKWDGAGGG